MHICLRALLVIVSAGFVQSATSDFLKNTLDKINKERLDTINDHYNQTDYSSDNNGEILFDEEDNSVDVQPNEVYELSLTQHSIEPQEQQADNTKNKQQTHQAGTSSQSTHSDGSSEGEIQGYYYYFYPLNNYLQNMKQQQPEQSMQPAAQDPMKDTDMMNMVMDSMMKNSMMMKDESRVTPLFQAMTWFLGTAMIFILSILLMPKFRVKKAKGIFDGREWRGHIPETFTLIPILDKILQ